MRTIKFRGKRKDNGEWVIGQLIYCLHGGIHIITYADTIRNSFEEYEVIPETVGQFTGLLDKNGNEIWEGDLMKALKPDYGSDAYEEWLNNNCLGEEPKLEKTDIVSIGLRTWLENEDFGWEGEGLETPEEWEVIGTIHD